MGSILKQLVYLGGRIASIETVDRMADRQIAEKVDNCFQRQGFGAVILTAVDVRN
jgi:hypothetical protein